MVGVSSVRRRHSRGRGLNTGCPSLLPTEQRLPLFLIPQLSLSLSHWEWKLLPAEFSLSLGPSPTCHPPPPPPRPHPKLNARFVVYARFTEESREEFNFVTPVGRLTNVLLFPKWEDQGVS